MDGIVNVLKPVGMTSTDVVYWLKRKLKVNKAGHIGTLDPGAAGVLPICIGKAARLAEYHTMQTKAYRAEIKFGITTDTEDSFGRILTQTKTEISRKDFLQVTSNFLGDICQIPPMYSSVRIQGKHLYDYARKGLEVDRPERQVSIDKLDLVEWYDEEYPRAIFDVTCSKGTYIRTLCTDIGQAMGCGAHMSFLVRTCSGVFGIEESRTFSEIELMLAEGSRDFLYPLDFGLALPKAEIPDHRVQAFKNGLPSSGLVPEEDWGEEKPLQVIARDAGSGEMIFCGIGIWKEDSLFPYKVL
ncbi:tRNA pseudouridine synthase B [Syntrophobotulus glycolicus DSM 8271]|uniref:tRNA pseudouridine synthase B n=1 Tax=Syntrophobotulus glycolicus (strain DSM 8271 / FlGlyR) TaxID=645991 RepID=F0SU14_SYNGF|nr:tRNA pseudouridine(55) synthase TruB [Syntrophobotulus glycolicus]ADY56537.1 tRNA pseudouridine synthase B [Syntrophobotulus glycolicus DSM 8271]